MSRTLSIFLDAIRFLAAIMVVAGHFSQGTFTDGWPDRTRVAVAAVAVFFVLSGFVISFVVDTKEKSLVDYTVARISRLYSVLVPAIVLSGIVLIIGLKLDPAYMYYFNNPQTNLGMLQSHQVFRFFIQSALSLTFLNSLHNHDAYPAMNSPVWSLGFEAPYYALFGIANFTRGRRRIFLLIAGCLLFGTGILRLFPVWLAGAALHRFSSEYKIPSGWSVPLGVACLTACSAAWFAWPSVDAWCSFPHTPAVEFLLRGKDRAAEAYLYYYWGVFICLLVLSVIALEKQAGWLLLPLERPIRWLAAHTFSLYLFHFPLLVLIYVTCHYNRASAAAKGLVFIAVVILCILLSTVTESKKYWWRQLVRRAFPARPALRPTVNAPQ